ncbi:MAG: M24 family metallopeptidase [Planctomycetota bacterium]
MATTRIGPKDLGRIAGRIIDDAIGDVDFSVRVTRGDYKKRWAQVQAVMKQKGYDVGYACGSELDRSDVAWISGFFDPIVERYAVLVPAEGKPVVLAGCEGHHVVKEAAEASGCDICVLREFQISDEEYRNVKCDSISDVVRKLKAGRNPKMVVWSPSEFLPHAQYDMLADTFGKNNVIYDPLMLQLIKYEKSLKELRVMQEANKVTDAAFRAMLAVTAPGVRESQVAGVGDFVCKALGAHRTGFPTIVTSGSRNYTVIGPATDKMIERGDVVSLGVSPTWHGYHGIVRRTVRAGVDFTAGQRKFVEAVEGLHNVVWEATIEAAAKNLPAKHTDTAGKAYLAKTKLKNLKGRWVNLKEPYSYLHNAGCSEAQEGYGAVTSDFKGPFGKRVSLMLDCALLGFEEHGKPVFPCLYAVVESSTWKNGKKVGLYNRIPISAQHLAGNEKPISKRDVNCYYRPL